MKYIHPFPARMAPEIALNELSALKGGKIVLDPMCGSGMVLNVAARQNLSSIGIDLDPLARLISRVGATKIDGQRCLKVLDEMLVSAKRSRATIASLNWISDNKETTEFIKYWFADKQASQLARLSYQLVVKRKPNDEKIRRVLMVALSRLIVTKEPKASLARDTAHSRPHRTIKDNDFDVFDSLKASLQYVIDVLTAQEIQRDSQTYLGDARRLTCIDDKKIDCIVTSPPYLNAIDYMRGHKFSLVWFGYKISQLRRIRGGSIGVERSNEGAKSAYEELAKIERFEELGKRNESILRRYCDDLCNHLAEAQRVLKRGATALYVIGNCEIVGIEVRNNEILKFAAERAGLRLRSETSRDIPSNKRYLPVAVAGSNALSKRMRQEYVVSFVK